jgi:hypothetical protein
MEGMTLARADERVTGRVEVEGVRALSVTSWVLVGGGYQGKTRRA